MSFVSTKYNYYRFLITKVKGTGSSSPVINEITVRDTSNNTITNLSISGSSTNDVLNNDVDKLIDGSGSTYWTCLSGRYTNGIPTSSAAITYTNIRRNLSGEWFQIYSPTAFDLKDIIIRSSSGGIDSQPDNIIVLGSISGYLWYIHHMFNNITYINDVATNNVYDISAYSYYRFIGARLIGKRALLQINELQLIGSEPNVTNNVEYPPINLSGGQSASFNIPQYNISGQAYGNGIYNLLASSVGYNLWPTNTFDDTGFSYASAESLNCYSDGTDSEGGSWPTGTEVTTVSQMTISGQWCQIQLPVSIVLNRINYIFRDPGGSPESFVIAGSNNGTTWSLVRFFNRLPFNQYHNIFNFLHLTFNVPSSPTNIIASKVGNNISVSFTAPSYTGDTNIIYYNVKSSPDGITVSGLSSPITVPGLTEVKSYTFTVNAVNVKGESIDSSNSNIITYNTLSDPQNISISGGVYKVNIYFTSVSGATYYKIIYGISGQFDLSRNILSSGGEISGLIASTFYNFKIFPANNSSIFNNPETIFGTIYYTYIYPQIQVPVFTLSGSNRSVLVTINSVPDATAYKIYYGISGQGFTNSITRSTLSGYITGLFDNIWYQFRVSSLYGTNPAWVYGISQESTQSSTQYGYSFTVQPTAINNFSIIRTGINGVTQLYNYQTTRIKYINSNTRVVSGYSFQNMDVYDSSSILKFTINAGNGTFGYNIIYQNGVPIYTILYNGANTRSEFSNDITVTEKHIYTIGDCQQDLSLSTLSVSGATISSTYYTTNPNDTFITKYDLSGNLNWITRIGGSATESGKCITSFGNNIYIGTTTPSNNTTRIYDTSNNIVFSISGHPTQTSALITCYSDTGIPKWRVYSYGTSAPGSITTDGVYIYVTGTAVSNTQFFSSNDISFNYNMVNAAGFIMCINNSGIIQWITKITGATLGLTSITVYNNNLYIGGQSNNAQISLFNAANSSQSITPYAYLGGQYGIVMKYTISGAPLWLVETKGPNFRCIVSDIAVNGNGIYFTSQYQNTVDIFDSSANNIKTHTTISGDNTATIKLDHNGKYIYSHTSYSKQISNATHTGGLDVYNNLVTYSVYSLSGAIYDTYDISQGSLEAYSQYIIENTDLSASFTLLPTPQLQSISNTSYSIDLSWTNISGAQFYKIYYGINSFTNTITLSGNINTYTLNTLGGGTYIILVTAINNYGESNESNIITFQTRPSQPTILSAVGGKNKATLTIQRAQGATTHFLKYKKTSSQNFTTIQIE